jgi:hypothetical protein
VLERPPVVRERAHVLQHAAQKKGEKARLEIIDDRRNGSIVSPPHVMVPAQP